MESTEASQEARQVYHREVDVNQRDSLSQIAARIAPSSTVLDVGTGSGALGRYLSSIRSIADGVSYSAREVELAKPHYRLVQCADIEKVGLDELFEGRLYDAIVFADVLEHLRDPTKTLEQANKLLRAGGKILISIPNIGYMGVVAGLMAGEFRYTDEGLLDRTHVRFFTRLSLLEMLSSVQLRATYIDAVTQPLYSSEFAHLHPDALAPSVRRALMSNSDALVYQFIVEAQRENEVQVPLSAAVIPKPELTFVAQVYWAGPDQPLLEANSVTCAGKIGESNQSLRFLLPAGAPIARLRLDPSDRPGSMILHRMRLCNRRGSSRWEWAGQEGVLRPAGNTFATSTREGLLIAMLDDDPSIQWNMDLADTEAEAGDYLECMVDWPTSPDAVAWKAQFEKWLRGKTALSSEGVDGAAGSVGPSAASDRMEARIEQQEAAHALELRLLGGVAVRLDAVARLHASELASVRSELQRRHEAEQLLQTEVQTLKKQVEKLTAGLDARSLDATRAETDSSPSKPKRPRGILSR